MRLSVVLCLLVAVVCVAAVETEKEKRPFTCLFLPGVGVDWPELDVEEKDRTTHPKFLREEFSDYWGDLARDVKQGCEKLYFYDTDTSYRGWQEPSLQREFSRVLAHTRPHVVFAHGSANLVLSACAHSKQKGCKRLGDKTVWYGIQAPLKGTDAPKVMQKLCPKLVENPIFKGGVDCVEQPSKSANKNKDKADKQGKAPAAAAAAPAPAPGAAAAATAPHPPPQGAATPAPAAGAAAPAPAAAEKKKYKLSAAWKALVPAEVPRWVHKVAVEKMGGSMCGVTPTDYSKPKAEVEKSAFATIAAAVAERRGKSKRRDEAADWKARNALSRQKVPRNGNDGIVSFTSCRVRSHSEYEKKPTAKHYVIDGDYDFGTCADGEDKGSGNREPCSWIANMVTRTREKKGYGKPRFAQIVEEEEEEEEVEDEEEEEETEEEEEEEEESDE